MTRYINIFFAIWLLDTDTCTCECVHASTGNLRVRSTLSERSRIRSPPTVRGQKLDGTVSGGFFRPNPAKPFPGKGIQLQQQQQARRRHASVEAEDSGAHQRQRPTELIDDVLPSPHDQQVKHGLSLVGDNCVFQTFADRHVYKAAGTKDCHKQWCSLTSDSYILKTVAGTLLEFEAVPVQMSRPRPLPFAKYEVDIIDEIVDNFLASGMIERTINTNDDFVSNVFIRNKKNGSHRLILNLINLNMFIEYHHFKMDTIETVINLMRPNCFMGSIDLANAYFSIPVAIEHRRFLKFEWKHQMYQFRVLPNGLSSAPRLFTKILKPVYAHLRLLGHLACGYIDDSIFMAQTFDSCQDSIRYADSLFRSIGFYINYDKSELKPMQEIEHLGFVLNSTRMTVTLTEAKKVKLVNKCTQVLADNGHTIRSVAELIGLIVSSFTGAEYGRLHFRQLEADKVQALNRAAGDFDS